MEGCRAARGDSDSSTTTFQRGVSDGLLHTRQQSPFYDIRLTAKAEADKAVDSKAHEKGVDRAWSKKMLPVPGTEYPVEARSDPRYLVSWSWARSTNSCGPR